MHYKKDIQIYIINNEFLYIDFQIKNSIQVKQKQKIFNQKKKMSNLSTQHLIKCIIQKDKYKQTQLYIKQLQLQSQQAQKYINEALQKIIVTNNYQPASKLYGLRFFKDIFISGQIQIIHNINQNIMKHIYKTSQYDKENPDKSKRGTTYFQLIQKRTKSNDLQKMSYSFVTFCTEIVYVMGVWYAIDLDNEKTQFAIIYEKLRNAKIPFPSNDKQLKYFKPEQRQTFNKNYKEWVQKLPEIEQQSDQGEQKQNMNQKSKKQIKSKQKITLPQQNINSPKQKLASPPLLTKDQNKIQELKNDKIKERQQDDKKANTLQIKRLKQQSINKQKELILIRSKLEEQRKKRIQFEQKSNQLQNDLKRTKQLTVSSFKNQQQKVKIKNTALQSKCSALQSKYLALQSKHTTLQNKIIILQKENNQYKTKFQQCQTIKQKLLIQCQQQKHLIKKISIQKNESDQKYRKIIQQTNNQLESAQDKIRRLQRQIGQLNAIKKSYKTLMEQDQPSNKNKHNQQNITKNKLYQQNITKNNQQSITKNNSTELSVKQTTQQLRNKNNQLSEKIKIIQKNQEQIKRNNQQINKQKQKLQKKLKEYQNNMEQIGEFYSKQIINFKTNIQSLNNQKSKLQSLLKDKNQVISQLQNQIILLSNNPKSNSTNQYHILSINLDDIKPQLKNIHLNNFQNILQNNLQNNLQNVNLNKNINTSIQHKKINSMSDYLQSQTILFQSSFNDPLKSISDKIQNKNKPKQQNINFKSQDLNECTFKNLQKQLKQKVKNKSLGKTQKSQQKVKQRNKRYSAGKTFHFSNNDSKKYQQIIQFNNKNVTHFNNMSNSKIYQSNSHNNLFRYSNKTPQNYFQSNCMNNDHKFNKKSSALLLQRRSYCQQNYHAKTNKIQTLVPYIDNYFSSKVYQNSQDQWIFKSLCLHPHMRQKLPIFVDKLIQVKLFCNSLNTKQVFVLQVMNVSYSSMKVKAVSCHDQFKILGDKKRHINSNSTVQYQIQTRNKDLNLRSPVISLMINQDQNRNNQTYNVTLPLTLFQFTQMKNQIPQFYEYNSSKFKIIKSQTFKLNNKFSSLKDCFPNLQFKRSSLNSRFQVKQKEISWQGSLYHSFIQNVQVYFKINQSLSQVSLQFAYRQYDKISQNYSKAMVQTLMYLLQ